MDSVKAFVIASEHFYVSPYMRFSMYLLFLDASGHSEFPPPYGRGKDTYYVLAGLAIEHTRWFEAYTGLNQLCRHYFPSVQSQIEPHYADLISKRGVWVRLTDEQRKAFADKVFEIIRSINSTLFAMVINKVKHYEGYPTVAESPRQLAVRFMVPRFSKFLQRKRELGIMVYDSETITTDRPLRDFLTRGRLQGVVMEANFDFNPEAMFQTQNRLEGIVESIFFLESKNSPGIQLTDFCAYAVWSKFERSRDSRFKEIYDLFDREGSNVYGLRVWEPPPWNPQK